MNEFLEETNSGTEYKYKILVWPNITYSDDLEKDSYVQVMHNVIKSVSKNHPDVFWYVVTPKLLKSFQFDNVEQLIHDFPTYPNSMRIDFDFKKIHQLIDWRSTDIDLVYSHLPEATLQLANLFYNTTDIHPEFLGYCHWYEIEENTSYGKNVFLNNIAGTLQMKECGVNSKWLKDLILDKASKYYSGKVISQLNRIIQPHYLGTDIDLEFDNPTIIPKSILFNHRPSEYTGWESFLKSMDLLYIKRQDFTVYTTLAPAVRPYIKKLDLNKKDYYDLFKKMHVGVGCFKDYSAWSLSVVDGLSRGLPYLLPNKLCYPEMVGIDYPLFYKTDDQFLVKLEKILDNPTFKNDNYDYLENIVSGLSWDSCVDSWFNNWDIFNSDNVLTKKTDKYKEIYEFIKTKRFVSKKDIIDYLGWGMNIVWTPYRNMLRKEKHIKFVKNGYEFVD